MQILSEKQFKEKYGTAGISKFSEDPLSTEKPTTGIGSRIADAFKSGIQQTKEGFQQVGNSGGNPLTATEGALKFGAGLVNTATAPLAPLTAPISAGINSISENLSNRPDVQALATSPQGERIQRGAEDIANLSTVGGAIAGGMKAPDVKTGVSNTLNKAKTGISDLGKVDPAVLQTEKLNGAIKDATPNFETSTEVQKGKLLSRTQEGGILKGRTVKPTDMEIEAGTEMSKIPEYDHTATKLAKYQVVKNEIGKRAEQLSSSLENEKLAIPKREIVSKVSKAINAVPEKSLLLQKADPAIKNYVRVLKNSVQSVPGTLKGILDLRKLLDNAYENARGNSAFGSDKISALDEVHKAARNALTEQLISYAKNTDVKTALRSQWNLYRALDELQIAAEKESGSIIGRAIQKNPITAKILEAGARATGFGAGVNIIK